jgi:hypothetical protein
VFNFMDFDASSQSTVVRAIQCATQRVGECSIERLMGGFCMRLNPLLRDGLGCAPNHRPTVRLWKGKNRQRAYRCEEFERSAWSPPSHADFGQQGRLAEIPNVGLSAWIAIGMNQ